MKKALKSLVSVLAASSLVFVPDSHGQTTGSASSKPTEVRIGYLLPLSAENAPQGQQSKRAIDMAVEEINGGGGINPWAAPNSESFTQILRANHKWRFRRLSA